MSFCVDVAPGEKFAFSMAEPQPWPTEVATVANCPGPCVPIALPDSCPYPHHFGSDPTQLPKLHAPKDPDLWSVTGHGLAGGIDATSPTLKAAVRLRQGGDRSRMTDPDDR